MAHSFLTVASRGALYLLLASGLLAQLPDLLPQRGVYPNGSYIFDKLESINNYNGVLTYTIPITSLPLGRGGMTVPVNLSYSSALADYYPYMGTQGAQTVTYGAEQASSSGGWRFSGFNYSLYEVSAPIQNCVAHDNNGQLVPVSPPPFQFGLIMPDGAHHLLKLYGQTDSYSNYSYWFNPVTGQDPCTQQTLASPLTYYTDDGSYIRVSVNTSNPTEYPTGGPYTIYLPDGTQIASSGWGAWANGEPASAIPANGTITDRNGNKVTITINSTTSTTTLTDDLGRTITISGTSVTQTGFNGATLTWTLGGYTTITGSTTCSNAGFQGCGSYSGGGPGYLQVPSDSGTLQYQFAYDPTTGQLTSVTLPTGATTTYSYGGGSSETTVGLTTFYTSVVTGKVVTWTDHSDGGSASRSESWTYAYGCPAGPPCSTTITAPDQGIHKVTFKGGSGPLSTMVTKETMPDGSTKEYLYQQNPPFNEGAQSTGGTNPANPYPELVVTTVASGGSPASAAVEKRTIDQNGNLTADIRYDWIAYSQLTHDSNGALSGFHAGSALQSTTNTYQPSVSNATNAAGPADYANGYWNPGTPLLRWLLKRSVLTGSGTGAVTEFDYSPQGNKTQERYWDSNKASSQPASLNASNSDVINRGFDSFGNVTSIQDANGNTDAYTYDTNNLYPITEVQASGSAQQRSFSYTWDGNIGVVTSKTDNDNHVVTSYNYDAMGRQTNVTEAGMRQTNTFYDDANNQVYTYQDQNTAGDQALVSLTIYDQLGRVNELQTPSNHVQSRYLYSGANSYRLTSNPYQASSAGGASGESTMGWTVATLDQNGRTVTSESFGGSSLPAPWGSNGNSTGVVRNAYSATATVNTDQVGNQWTRDVDGLGRLTGVSEYPASGTTSYTSYGYDSLGDLTSVNQSGQMRTFVYDSRKRLIASTNPETYSTANNESPALGCGGGVYTNCYYYDSNGNLTKKTDNRGVGVQYAYDALNRIQTKTYFNLPLTVNYVGVQYTYDNSGNYSRGQVSSVSALTQAGAAISTTNYLQYDPLGRVLGSSQTTGGNSYSFSYAYNLTDSLTSEAYPSGHVVSTCYDSANRVSQVGGSTCGNAAGAYASGVQYAAHNQPTQYVMGNNVWHSPSYNSRLQMSSFIDAVNGSPSNELLTASLSWCLIQQNGASNGGSQFNTACSSPVKDNGNLIAVTYNHGGAAANNGGIAYPSFLTFTDTYVYDGVNRLNTAFEWNGSSPNGSRSFAYDTYGNMWVSYTSSNLPVAGNTPTSDIYNGNNQIAGGIYDQVGNQTSVNGNTIGYDFESRQTSVAGLGVNETYAYDGDGHRVEKASSGGPSTVFVYDVFGRMAAEYSTAVDTPTCVTCYLTPDHLGTPRLITDQNGIVVSRHDYMPFGDEIPADNGTYATGRNQQWGPGNDSINQKFTGQQRDSESGLDYFGARYYGSALGRFTSPDWTPTAILSLSPLPYVDIRDPQSLNLYSYVRNRPLSSRDADGHFIASAGEGDPQDPPEEELERENEAFRDMLRAAEMREREEREAEYREALRRMTPAQRNFMLGRYLPRAGGRWGGASTRAQNSEIALTAIQNGFHIQNGGGAEPEEYIPGSGGNGRTFVDLTLVKGDTVIRVQTIDTQADGQPTPKESAAADRIKAAFPKDVLVLIPKNSEGRILDATFK